MPVEQGATRAHDVLFALYPSFAAQFDAQLGQSLAQVPDGEQKTKGVRIGQDVAARITIDESSHRLCGSRELATAVRNAA